MMIRSWQNPQLTQAIGWGLIVYNILVAFHRYHLRGVVGLYYVLWACNVAMLLGAVGMVRRRADLICVSVSIVTLPHILWVVDATSYVYWGTFQTGVASYLAWDNLSAVEFIFTLHHVWYIPLCILLLRRNGGLIKNTLFGMTMSFCALVPFSRLVTPLEADGIYLNVNLGYEIWREVEPAWTHVFDPPNLPWAAYFIVIVVILNTANWIVYFVVASIVNLCCNPKVKATTIREKTA